MTNQGIIKTLFAFLLYALLQIIFGRNMILGNYAFCFPYVAFLLAIPFDISRVLYMLLAFFTGLAIDIAYNTVGFHAASCVVLAYSRAFVMNINKPSGGYEADMKPTLSVMGLPWFISYSFLLIFVHHFIFFLIEASNFSLIGNSILKTLASTLFTFTVVLILQAFYVEAKRRR
ncbi:MAG: Rod shape-determining protein MreD [Flammeovirgaceae bacterium]